MFTITKKQYACDKFIKIAIHTTITGALLTTPILLYANDDIEKLRLELESQRKLIEQLQQSPPTPSEDKSSTLSIYGILDTGVEHITNIGEDGDSLTRIPAITGTLPSRLGFDLATDLGKGYKALAKLEMGFNADDGTQGQAGRLFGRQLYLGMQTPLGRITVGRQYSVFLFGVATSDLLGPNIYALGSLDAYLPNARYDNSLSWNHKFGDSISTGFSYSFGRDTTGGVPASGACKGEENAIGESSECVAWSGMLKYDNGTFGLSAAIDTLNGGDGALAYFFNGAAQPIDMSDPDDTDQRVSLGGYFKFGNTKIGIGNLNRKLETVSTDVESETLYVTGNYKFTSKFSLDGGIYDISNDDQKANATLAVIRGMYNLSKGLDGYGQIGYISNNDNAAHAVSGAGPNTAPNNGENQTGYMIGLRYIF